MAVLLSFFTSFGISVCCGTRAGVCLALISILARTGVVSLDSHFAFMQSAPFMILALLAAFAEAGADKFKNCSRFLDSSTIALRTIIAAWLAVSLLYGEALPLETALGGVLGGFTAFLVNFTRPLTKVWLTDLLPSATVAAAVLLSVFEDVMSMAVLLAAVFCPWLGLFCGIAGCAGGVFVLCKFIGNGGRPLSWHWNRICLREVE